MKCDCGQDVAPDTVLCGGCGRFVDHSRVAPDAGVAPPPAPPAPGPEADATPPGPLGSVGPLNSAVPGAPGIQRCAVAAFEHMLAHRDHTLLVELYQALSKGMRRASMAAWIMQFTQLTANTDAASKADKPFVLDKDKAHDLEGAKETM